MIMIEKKIGTKEHEHYFRAYLHSQARKLEDCYKTFSYKKEYAYQYCTDVAQYHGGLSNAKIISHNCMKFTYAFFGEYIYKGMITHCFFVITPYHEYVFCIPNKKAEF